jgi:hypothetical protein
MPTADDDRRIDGRPERESAVDEDVDAAPDDERRVAESRVRTAGKERGVISHPIAPPTAGPLRDPSVATPATALAVVPWLHGLALAAVCAEAVLATTTIATNSDVRREMARMRHLLRSSA